MAIELSKYKDKVDDAILEEIQKLHERSVGDLEKQIKTFEGSLQDAQEKLSSAQDGLEKQIAKAVENGQKELQAELQKQKNENQSLLDSYNASKAIISKSTVEREVSKTLISAGVRKDDIELLESFFTTQAKLSEDGQVLIGDTTAGEAIKQYIEKNPSRLEVVGQNTNIGGNQQKVGGSQRLVGKLDGTAQEQEEYIKQKLKGE